MVAIASELFRDGCFDGVGVADLMERAELTHGGFFNHFASKEVLNSKSAAKGLIDMSARYARYSVGEMINAYISRTHRDARGLGCPAAALSGEAARLPDGTREVFGAGIAGLVTALQGGLSATYPDARAKAISLLAQAVGAIMLSRACPDHSARADEILETCRAVCLIALADPD